MIASLPCHNQGNGRFGARGKRRGRGNRRGFCREFVRIPRGQERFYGGLKRQWERNPRGHERFERELERNDEGHYEERELGKIEMNLRLSKARVT